MRKIEIPASRGVWGRLDIARRVSSVAVLLWLIYQSLVSGDYLPIFLALATVPLGLAYTHWRSGRIDGRLPDVGVFVDSQIVIVQSANDTIRIPVAEATVRIDKQRVKRTQAVEVQDAQPMPFTHKLYIDHGDTNTEIDVIGLLPHQIADFADELQHTFTETRAQFQLPEPHIGELET